MTKTDVGKSKCPICNNTGFERYINEDGYEIFRECGCGIRAMQIESKRLEFANIPQAFKNYRFKNFPTTKYKNIDSKNLIMQAMKKISHWLKHIEDMESRGLGLYLWSETRGSGKTRMITSIANTVMEDYKIGVKFTTSMQILNEIKSTWDKNSAGSESKLLNSLATTSILIIDDFGTEQAKDWVGEKFYTIINQRYIDKKITLFTSNMSINDLPYDDRIVNRLKEMTYEIHFPEESIREQIKESNERELREQINNNANAPK